MALIKYQSGIPPLPAKWTSFLSGLLDSAGILSITISSTRRSVETNAAAMYTNIRASGVPAALRLYNSAMRQVVQVYADMVAKGRNRSDTINAMAQKTYTVGLPVHTREQNDAFCVFDVPPQYIPANRRGAFERIIGKNASKLIKPGNSDPVYHIEFGGVRAGAGFKPAGTLAGIIAGIVACFLLIKR